MCGERVTTKYQSPDKSSFIVWKARSCGATTASIGTTYILSESRLRNLDTNNPKISRKYRIFSSERGTIKVRWLSNDHIEVLYDFSPQYGRTGQFFKQRHEVSGVKITYTQMNRELIKKSIAVEDNRF